MSTSVVHEAVRTNRSTRRVPQRRESLRSRTANGGEQDAKEDLNDRSVQRRNNLTWRDSHDKEKRDEAPREKLGNKTWHHSACQPQGGPSNAARTARIEGVFEGEVGGRGGGELSNPEKISAGASRRGLDIYYKSIRGGEWKKVKKPGGPSAKARPNQGWQLSFKEKRLMKKATGCRRRKKDNLIPPIARDVRIQLAK